MTFVIILILIMGWVANVPSYQWLLYKSKATVVHLILAFIPGVLFSLFLFYYLPVEFFCVILPKEIRRLKGDSE